MTSDNKGMPRFIFGAKHSRRDAVLVRVIEALSDLARRSSDDGTDLLDACTRQLARAFNVAHAAILTFADDSLARPQNRSNWMDGQPAETFNYELAGSPLVDVLSDDKVFVASGLANLYPRCLWVVEQGFDAFYGVLLRDQSGQPIGVVLVADRQPMDLADGLSELLPVFADRIAQEIELSPFRAGQDLASDAFTYTPQGVMITDRDHRIIKVNPAFIEITGWTPSEVIGRRQSMLSAGRDEPGLRGEIQTSLDQGGVWLGELWSRRSDGEVFPENRTVVAVPGEDGQITHYLNLFNDISAEKFAAERIHRLAHYDATTELPNRVLLQDRLLHAINSAARVGAQLALLFLDLDGFKLINDSLGHSAGDEVLRLVGERLTSRLRKADVVARVGGDEFAVVLSDIDQDSDVQVLCDQLLQVVTEPYELGGRTGHVTTSIGIAMFPEDGTDVQTLLKHADAAMYQAKEGGKNRYAFYEPEMNRRAEERLKLSRQLRGALEKDAFSLCYQPQFDLATGRLTVVEALLRWRDDDGEMVAPTRFIPLAEDTGLIMALGAWVLQQACQQAQAWRDQGLEFGRLAVNISGRQFQGERLRATVDSALALSGLPGNLLELEITESWVMEGPFKAEAQMAALREMGVNLVIDDFGIANSSMAYLKRFPVQKLKIDRSFIRDIPGDREDAAIVSAIIAMGHSLGMRVVAEGVETSEQSAFLRGTGCDEVQGFLYGRPVPSDEMNVLILYSPTLSST